MRFAVALFTLFAAGSTALQAGSPVLSTPTLVKRDGPSVSSALSAIIASVKTLQDHVSVFTGTSKEVSDLAYSSGDVIEKIEAGISTAKASGELTQTDALNLVPQIQTLSNITFAVTIAVIQKKQIFASTGVGPIVLQTFRVQLQDSQQLNEAIISKVPASLQSFGTTLSAPIIKSLQGGVTAFTDQDPSKEKHSGAIHGAAPTSAGFAAVALTIAAAVIATF